METEIWTTIRETGILYEVSSLGRVRKYKGGTQGYVYINPYYDSSSKGVYVAYTSVKGKRKTRKLATVVAREFVPNPKGLKYARPKNGDEWDARASNLYWTDGKSGANSPMRVMDVDTGKVYRTATECAKDTLVSVSSVGKSVKTGKRISGKLFKRVEEDFRK